MLFCVMCSFDVDLPVLSFCPVGRVGLMTVQCMELSSFDLDGILLRENGLLGIGRNDS